MTGKQLSQLSKISSVRQNNYIKYNEEQKRLYQLLNTNHEAKKRKAKLQQSRKQHQEQRKEYFVRTSYSNSLPIKNKNFKEDSAEKNPVDMLPKISPVKAIVHNNINFPSMHSVDYPVEDLPK